TAEDRELTRAGAHHRTCRRLAVPPLDGRREVTGRDLGVAVGEGSQGVLERRPFGGGDRLRRGRQGGVADRGRGGGGGAAAADVLDGDRGGVAALVGIRVR